jgi:glycerol-3-phosphate dehydrogenase
MDRAVHAGISPLAAGWLPFRYGNQAPALITLAEERGELAKDVLPGLPFCAAELVHTVRHEMAVTLEDVLRRRIPALLIHRFGEDSLRSCASLIGEEAGWASHRLDEEQSRLLETWG